MLTSTTRKSLFAMTMAAIATTQVLSTPANIHPKLAHLTSTEREARQAVLSTLPAKVRRHLEELDPDEYTVEYEHLLGQGDDGETTGKSLLQRRGGAVGPGVKNCVGDNVVGMTYDDGPYTWTSAVADKYKAAGHHVTFFININNWDCAYDAPYAEQVQHAFSTGHVIGSHTANHPDIKTLSLDELDEQLQYVETYMWDVLGVIPAYFRPPYGSTTEEINDHIREKFGYHIIEWSIDSRDADGATPQQSIDTIRTAGAQDIILNHETHDESVHRVADTAIAYFAEKGLTSQNIAKCSGLGKPYKVRLNKPLPQRKDNWTCQAKNVPEPKDS